MYSIHSINIKCAFSVSIRGRETGKETIPGCDEDGNGMEEVGAVGRIALPRAACVVEDKY